VDRRALPAAAWAGFLRRSLSARCSWLGGLGLLSHSGSSSRLRSGDRRWCLGRPQRAHQQADDEVFCAQLSPMRFACRWTWERRIRSSGWVHRLLAPRRPGVGGRDHAWVSLGRCSPRLIWTWVPVVRCMCMTAARPAEGGPPMPVSWRSSGITGPAWPCCCVSLSSMLW